ncbi:uncharacterized protein LOC135923549 [Gordionus sp. m RMFG-2023]|uniref:uncharacterized protein LOC135923549 n=1 Tax=Gordionus sp. m RMFG-2023 TaxID=3053472 RepID=UPI0031FBD371
MSLKILLEYFHSKSYIPLSVSHFALFFLWTMTICLIFDNRSFGCPCFLFMDYLKKKMESGEDDKSRAAKYNWLYLIRLLGAQFLGLFLTFLCLRLANIGYYYGIHDAQAIFSRKIVTFSLIKVRKKFDPALARALITVNAICSSDLKVTPYLGFLAEFSAMLALLITMYIAERLKDKYSWHLMNRDLLDLVSKSLVATCLVCVGAPFTGMYFNPLLASALTVGCNGSTFYRDIFVYWLGPLSGVLLFYFLIHQASSNSIKKKNYKS